MRILICPLSEPGYLYPSIAVGLELRARGDDVFLIGHAAARATAAQAGLATLPAESFGARHAFHVGRWFRDGAPQYHAIVRAARSVDADALLSSILCLGALPAAEHLDLPVVVLGFAAHLWSYRAHGPTEPATAGARVWRLAGQLRFYEQLLDQIGRARRHPPPGERALVGSGLLLRGCPKFEYPGSVLPDGVRHIGPCHWEPPIDRAELDAIRDRTNRAGKPVVYAHLGRVFGGESLWPRLNAAVAGSRCQAIVEQGRSESPRPAPGEDILVVRKPWMAPLIELAGAVVTNATSAPVLGALLAGRPLVVAPNGSEQPVLAEACLRAGVAAALPPAPGACGALLDEVMADAEIRHRARQLGAELARLDGPATAAAAVHAAVHGTGRAYA